MRVFDPSPVNLLLTFQVALISRSSCDETLGMIAGIDGLSDVSSVAHWFV